MKGGNRVKKPCYSWHAAKQEGNPVANAELFQKWNSTRLRGKTQSVWNGLNWIGVGIELTAAGNIQNKYMLRGNFFFWVLKEYRMASHGMGGAHGAGASREIHR